MMGNGFPAVKGFQYFGLVEFPSFNWGINPLNIMGGNTWGGGCVSVRIHGSEGG